MLKLILALILGVFVSYSNSKVNMFIGTGGLAFGCGSNSPAAQVPYSYVRLGPDTTPLNKKLYQKFQHFGGYSDMDHAVRAFSHMHLVGAGVQDMGVYGFFPNIVKNPTQIPIIPKDLQTPFYKQYQYAEPGYYSSILKNDIKVQLTSTQRCGVHRYTFKPSKSNGNNKINQIYLMSSYLLQKKAERNSITSKCQNISNCIQGSILIKSGFGSRFGGYKIHFHTRWRSPNETKIYLYDDKNISSQINTVKGNYTGGIIRTKSQSIQFYVGISYVSVKNAKINLQKQVNLKQFDQIKQQSLSIWKKQLSRFDITAINEKQQQKIDTAIYRTLSSPTIFEDQNGQYMSFRNDGSVQIKPDNMTHVYTDMSLWDVHRTQMPWIAFQDMSRYYDISQSLLLINRQGGYMPKWPFAMGPTGCMIGSHANTVLSDWVVKQAYKDQKVDKNQILSFMLRNANTQTAHDSRRNPIDYLKYQYINADQTLRDSASETLQYSYNDFGIHQVAKIIGNQQISTEFLRRSKFYKNVWNEKQKFFISRFKNGTFFKISQSDKFIFSNHYVQGDAWQYRFYAPHDVAGLVQLFGSKQKFIQELSIFFSRSKYWPILSFPNPYYWAGNQHDLFSVWQFQFVNRSDLTEKFSRKILSVQYGNDGAGLPGNDDYGTMSAWLIFASLGFYPLPSTNIYALGSPLISQATIYRRGKDGNLIPFYINVRNNSYKNYLTDEISLNGKSVKNLITYQELNIKNARLEFLMKSK